MRAKIFLSLFFIFLFEAVAFAQLPTDSLALNNYQEAESDMILLRNQEDILPLRRLDSLRVTYFRPAVDPSEDMLSTYLKKYTIHSVLGKDSDRSTADVLIVGLNPRAMISGEWADFRKNWATINAKMTTILVWLGQPALLAGVKESAEADAILTSAGPAPFASVLAAQAVFGAVEVKGKLTDNIGSRFEAGTGIQTASMQRLGYAPPGVVGYGRRQVGRGHCF